MFQTNLVQEPKGDNLDADAVCSQCHTINDVGVLICKSCGNNLRDQRHDRLGEEALLFGAEKGRKRKFLIRALGIFGILLVIWVALNSGSVADWAVRVTSGAPPDGRVFWEGEDAAVFDLLRTEVEGLSPSPAVIRQAVNSGIVSMDFDGPYVVMQGNNVIGHAVARTVNNQLYVEALSNNGIEVRAKVQQEGFTLALVPGNAAYRSERTSSLLTGQVQQDRQGVLRIGGKDEFTGQFFTCRAYRLPSR